MKRILLFGAGKSATCLIDYLIKQAPKYKWHITIVDTDPFLAHAKAGALPNTSVASFDVHDNKTRNEYIAGSDLVISMLPAALHILIAKSCIRHHKHLLTASYLLPEVQKLEKEIQKAGILFMGEMGLDPGIDHMSAMNLLQSIRKNGGSVSSFKSYCGALVAPKSDDNPWHYKISWSPKSLITAGKDGAVYRKGGKQIQVPYESLFGSYETVIVPGLEKLAYYPNRDSLRYAALYQLNETPDFIRATLRYPEFCEGWQAIIDLGLTDMEKKKDTGRLSYSDWTLQKIKNNRHVDAAEKLASFLKTGHNSRLMRQLNYLGLLSDKPLQMGEKTNGDILLEIMEDKLQMSSMNKDMVVMLHQLTFEQKNIRTTLNSYLIVLGEDTLRTAIAKTVGLPLGILTKLILTDKVHLTGLHIPIVPEIYEPVLKGLEEEGIRFEEFFS